MYVLLRDGDKVLLSRRANTGYQDGMYSVVAGHVEGDELATNAMVREAREEAGIKIEPSDLRLVHMAHRLGRGQIGEERIDLFFECTKWNGEIMNMEPEKCDDLSWFDVHDLPDTMLPFVRNVIMDIQSGIVFSEYETEPV